MALFEALKPSGEKDADTAIMNAKGYFGGILIITDGTNDATVALWDNASAASGTEIAPAIKVAGGDNYGGFLLLRPIYCDNGIYANVSGTGAKYEVYYQKAN